MWCSKEIVGHDSKQEKTNERKEKETKFIMISGVIYL